MEFAMVLYDTDISVLRNDNSSLFWHYVWDANDTRNYTVVDYKKYIFLQSYFGADLINYSPEDELTKRIVIEPHIYYDGHCISNISRWVGVEVAFVYADYLIVRLRSLFGDKIYVLVSPFNYSYIDSYDPNSDRQCSPRFAKLMLILKELDFL